MCAVHSVHKWHSYNQFDENGTLIFQMLLKTVGGVLFGADILATIITRILKCKNKNEENSKQD